jgi:hypothetical protein
MMNGKSRKNRNYDDELGNDGWMEEDWRNPVKFIYLWGGSRESCPSGKSISRMVGKLKSRIIMALGGTSGIISVRNLVAMVVGPHGDHTVYSCAHIKMWAANVILLRPI